MSTDNRGSVSLGLVMFIVGTVVGLVAGGFVVMGLGEEPPRVDFAVEDTSMDGEIRVLVVSGSFEGSDVVVEGVEGDGVVENREFTRGDVLWVDGEDTVQVKDGADSVRIVWLGGESREVLYYIPL